VLIQQDQNGTFTLIGTTPVMLYYGTHDSIPVLEDFPTSIEAHSSCQLNATISQAG
jgi:hypothetical protein